MYWYIVHIYVNISSAIPERTRRIAKVLNFDSISSSLSKTNSEWKPLNKMDGWKMNVPFFGAKGLCSDCFAISFREGLVHQMKHQSVDMDASKKRPISWYPGNSAWCWNRWPTFLGMCEINLRWTWLLKVWVMWCCDVGELQGLERSKKGT